MPSEHVLTLDLGSSGLRAHVVEIGSWEIAGEARRAYRIVRSGEGLSFLARDLRTRIVGCLAEAVRASGVASSITSVSVTAQRGGTAFVLGDGRPLYIAPNRDVRAVFEGAAIDDAQAEPVYSVTGHLPSMFFAPAKLHWWREHHERRARSVTDIVSLGAWAVGELTGVLAETPSTLTEMGLADVRTGQPDADLLTSLDLSLDLLSAIVQQGEPTGDLGNDATKTIGLPKPIPVHLAGPDAQVAALGAGAVEPGDTVVVAGWSAPVQRVTSAPVFDDARRMWVVRGQVDGTWASEANPSDTGGTLDTVRALMGRGMTPRRFDRLAASAPDTELPVVAAWGPRALNMSNVGMSLGGLIVPSPVTYEGLAPGTLARATLENVAFAVRECVGVLDEVCGTSGAPLILTGGMANSDIFASMLSTALAQTVLRRRGNSTAIGATMMAALSPGQLVDEARVLKRRAEVIEPVAVDVGEADARYERWLAVRAALDEMAEQV